MQPEDIIYALKQTNSRIEKAEVLNSLHADHDFWKGGHMALSPFITFGVKAIPDPDTFDKRDAFDRALPFRAFQNLADKLAARELTGHTALDAIKAFAQRCTPTEWENWYKLILAKDLECGVASSTFNASAPDAHKVKLFECQLATDMNKVKIEKFPTSAYLEAKYDGNRVLWFAYPNGKCDGYSRNGKLFHNFDSVGNQIAILPEIPNFPEDGFVIDGEIISKDFNTLQTQARRKTDAQFEGLFMAFDILTIDQFLGQEKTAPLSERRAVLEQVVGWLQSKIPTGCLVELSYAEKDVNAQTDFAKIMELFEEQVQAGFEGIMVKDATAPYEYKRTKSWLKMKPTDTYDMVITGYFEGEGRLVGSLGGLTVQAMVDGNLVTTNVGSGFSDELRAQLWAVKETLMGQVVEILADAVSKNKDGTYSLRFPRFVRFRDDKDA